MREVREGLYFEAHVQVLFVLCCTIEQFNSHCLRLENSRREGTAGDCIKEHQISQAEG